MLSKLILKIKNNKFRLPVWIGRMFSIVPFGFRPIVGRIYQKRYQEIRLESGLSSEQIKGKIFKRMYDLVEYAMANIPFYRDYYAEQGFNLNMLTCFEDLSKIPVIDKDILLRYSLDNRSNLSQPRILVNTGGSSGKTLSFYVQLTSIGHEWAHVHEIWSKMGYRQNMLKIMFVGRNNVIDVVDYDFGRHSLTVDIYKPFPDVAAKLKTYLHKYSCYYLHGYPSVIADFASYCLTSDEDLLNILKGNLKAVFLCSEYPYAKYREIIENALGVPTQSFYGHTERCVIAYESDEKYKFIPMQTYGFAEALLRPDGHYDLLGTSYYNLASPLIRYNTKDIIDRPVWDEGLLKEFHIYEGREGQNIIDKSGRVISLTGLIMGRHHKLFEYVDHIQITQPVKGKAIVLYVPKDPGIELDCSTLFDSSNVEVDFSFKEIEAPIRTISGKTNLLVRYESIENQ